MVTSLKEVVGDLRVKFASTKYKDDPGLLKQRVKEQGESLTSYDLKQILQLLLEMELY